MNQFDKEEAHLEQMLSSGQISVYEYNKEMQELQRDYIECAREAAEMAYEEEFDSW